MPGPAARLRPLRLPLLGVAAFSAALAVVLATHRGDSANGTQPAALRERDQTGHAGLAPADVTGRIDAATPAPPTVAATGQLIERAWDTDAAQRAAAIEALGRAPRARALPALERIVKTGEASVDRHVAVSALHQLAMGQGDADGAIRDLLRELIYDGNDEAVTENASAALASIETPRGAPSPATSQATIAAMRASDHHAATPPIP